MERKRLHQFFQHLFLQNNASGFWQSSEELFSGGRNKCSPLDSWWRSRGIVRSNVWSELSTFASDQFLRQSSLGFEAHHSLCAEKVLFFGGLPAAVSFRFIHQELQRSFNHLRPQLISDIGIEVILQTFCSWYIWFGVKSVKVTGIINEEWDKNLKWTYNAPLHKM